MIELCWKNSHKNEKPFEQPLIEMIERLHPLTVSVYSLYEALKKYFNVEEKYFCDSGHEPIWRWSLLVVIVTHNSDQVPLSLWTPSINIISHNRADIVSGLIRNVLCLDNCNHFYLGHFLGPCMSINEKRNFIHSVARITLYNIAFT